MTNISTSLTNLDKKIVFSKSYSNYNSPLILHIPHSSIYIPSCYTSIYLHPEQLFLNALTAADLYTDILYHYPAATLVFPVSRLLCDVERFRDQTAETMTKLGMWICYTHNMDGEKLASFNEQHVQKIISNYYDRHHTIFTDIVKNKLQATGRALIIDCHSFPALLPYYPPGEYPDICLGQDNYHTPAKLLRTCCKFLEQHDYTVAINFPFSGSIVPLTYYQKDKRVHSIMIEVARDLYVNQNNKKGPGFAKLQAALQGLLKILDS